MTVALLLLLASTGSSGVDRRPPKGGRPRHSDSPLRDSRMQAPGVESKRVRHVFVQASR